jgi:hypothetical protein
VTRRLQRVQSHRSEFGRSGKSDAQG